MQPYEDTAAWVPEQYCPECHLETVYSVHRRYDDSLTLHVFFACYSNSVHASGLHVTPVGPFLAAIGSSFASS